MGQIAVRITCLGESHSAPWRLDKMAVAWGAGTYTPSWPRVSHPWASLLGTSTLCWLRCARWWPRRTAAIGNLFGKSQQTVRRKVSAQAPGRGCGRVHMLRQPQRRSACPMVVALELIGLHYVVEIILTASRGLTALVSLDHDRCLCCCRSLRSRARECRPLSYGREKA